MKLEKIIIMLVLVMISTTSYAARRSYDDTHDNRSASKFYFGVGVGSMRTDIPNLNTSALSWSLIAGTAINQNLAVQIGYANLGSTDLGSSAYLKGSSYSLNLVGLIPVTHAVSMFAKFGFANTGVYVESGGSAGTTYSTAAPTIGLGIQAGVGKMTDLRIAYDNYKFSINNSSTYNADVTSLSVIFKF